MSREVLRDPGGGVLHKKHNSLTKKGQSGTGRGSTGVREGRRSGRRSDTHRGEVRDRVDPNRRLVRIHPGLGVVVGVVLKGSV